LVKSLVDGVVCALQSQTDRTDAELTAPRIASRLGVGQALVQGHLLDAGMSVLGVRGRLVHRYRENVQWRPDDDALVAGEVVLAPAKTWRVTGSVFAVVRR
jgi:hypothetical protein